MAYKQEHDVAGWFFKIFEQGIGPSPFHIVGAINHDNAPLCDGWRTFQQAMQAPDLINRDAARKLS
jgi:hypothetical protein